MLYAVPGRDWLAGGKAGTALLTPGKSAGIDIADSFPGVGVAVSFALSPTLHACNPAQSTTALAANIKCNPLPAT